MLMMLFWEIGPIEYCSKQIACDDRLLGARSFVATVHPLYERVVLNVLFYPLIP
jgi:hypothetical protein